MKPYFLTFMTLFLIFSACSNDDDNQPIEPDNHPIVGEWSLVYVSGGWNPTMTFEEDEILWSFQTDGTMHIFVQEGITTHPDDIFVPSLFGANYTYSINDDDGLLTLISDNYPELPKVLPFTIESDTLKIFDDEPSDGLTRKFIKN